MTELTDEAAAILERRAKRAGRSKKDLISTVIVKLEMWGDAAVALAYDDVPAGLVASDAFWALAQREALEGLRRCREKYGAKGA